MHKCYFCESEKVYVDGPFGAVFTRHTYYVTCPDCLASGPRGDTKVEAILNWQKAVKDQ